MNRLDLELRVLRELHTICGCAQKQLPTEWFQQWQEWTASAEELLIVQLVPEGISCIVSERLLEQCRSTWCFRTDGWKLEPGWRVIAICGQLDFALIGVLAKLSTALAEADISLFAQSTYDTDYLLVKQAKLEPALKGPWSLSVVPL